MQLQFTSYLNKHFR